VIWNIGLEKSGNNVKDEATKIHRIHPHVLRKFFRSQLGTVIPVDVVETLMGHENYLTEVYRKYPNPEQTLAKFYKQGEHTLLIFTGTEEVSRLRREVEQSKLETEDRNRQLQTLVNGLTAENLELKSRVSRVEMEILKLAKAVEKLLET